MDAKDLIDKAKEEQLRENIIGFYEIGLPNEKIAQSLKTTLSKVEIVIKKYLEKK